jgi:hypothetical protein
VNTEFWKRKAEARISLGGRFLKMLPEWLECANDKDGPWIKCEEVKS